MALKVRPDSSEAGTKQRDRVTNWSAHDPALVNRGNLTVWFDGASLLDQWTPVPPVGRSKPGWYSETAIQTCLTIKTLFQLPYRATEGLLKSLMRLCQLDLPVPDHSHLSRRAAALSVRIPRRPRQGAVHVVVDSTGLQIFGKGEWKVRLHGAGKRRTWRKVHLSVDETSQDIIGIEVSTAAWGDSQILPDLLIRSTARLLKYRPMAHTTATVAMRPSPGGTHGRPSRRETAQSCGETNPRATPFGGRSKPKESMAGRTGVLSTGAASRRT